MQITDYRHDPSVNGMRLDAIARSTFTEPLNPAVGVKKTWVAGILVWDAGATTGARPGEALRRSGQH